MIASSCISFLCSRSYKDKCFLHISIYLTYTMQALYIISYSSRIKIDNMAPSVSIKRSTKISHILCTVLRSCRVGIQVRVLMSLIKQNIYNQRFIHTKLLYILNMSCDFHTQASLYTYMLNGFLNVLQKPQAVGVGIDHEKT